MSDDFLSLPGTLDALWSRLERGAGGRDGPGRYLALASAGPKGPRVRMMVLRRADRASGRLTLYTNGLSGKVAALAAEPSTELLLWDEAAGFQARIGASVTCRPGAAAAWAVLGASARLNYAEDPSPGTPVADPAALAPKPSQALFTELDCAIRRIETLCLAVTPHRRAVFEDGTARWVAP